MMFVFVTVNTRKYILFETVKSFLYTGIMLVLKYGSVCLGSTRESIRPTFFRLFCLDEDIHKVVEARNECS